jgi:inward rectifier potassium channel
MATPLPPPSIRNHRRSSQAPRGSVIRVGRRRLTGDVYHFFMVAAWSHVLLVIAMAYLAVNALFACIYWATPDSVAGARPGSFADAFFFSVQTFATIGYGVMVPKTIFANLVVTFEAFIGLLAVAMATGLMFSKFSRPTARVLFSRRVVVTTRDGKPTLMLRMANERVNDIVEASFRLSVLLPEVSTEGEKMRRIYDLRLVRSDTPIFTITFTASHVIDESSPLAGHTRESLDEQKARFIVTLTGIDGTTGQTIHARHIYESTDIVFDARFVDVLSNGPDGRLLIDYTKFHEIHRGLPTSHCDGSAPATAVVRG